MPSQIVKEHMKRDVNCVLKYWKQRILISAPTPGNDNLEFFAFHYTEPPRINVTISSCSFREYAASLIARCLLYKKWFAEKYQSAGKEKDAGIAAIDVRLADACW